MNWFEAFNCWLQETLENPMSLKFTYKKAQGPVIPIFGTSMKGWFDDASQVLWEDPVAGYKGNIQKYKDQRLLMIYENRLARYKIQQKFAKNGEEESWATKIKELEEKIADLRGLTPDTPEETEEDVPYLLDSLQEAFTFEMSDTVIFLDDML